MTKLEIDAEGMHVPLQELVHWIIVGGESGPKARPMHPEWAPHQPWPPTLADDRVAVLDPGPIHMVRVGKKVAGRLLDGRTHDEFWSGRC